MICNPCRGEFYSIVAKKGEPQHDQCVNFWTIDSTSAIVKRPEPIRSCACQHKESWNFSVGGKEKNEGNNGDSSQS